MSPFSKLFGLIRLTYSRSQYRKVSQEIDSILKTRAWLSHCAITGVRGLLMILGWAPWQRALTNRSSVEHDEDLVNSVEGLVAYGTIALASAGLILDLISFKWLKVSNLLLYLELAFALLVALVPF